MLMYCERLSEFYPFFGDTDKNGINKPLSCPLTQGTRQYQPQLNNISDILAKPSENQLVDAKLY